MNGRLVVSLVREQFTACTRWQTKRSSNSFVPLSMEATHTYDIELPILTSVAGWTISLNYFYFRDTRGKGKIAIKLIYRNYTYISFIYYIIAVGHGRTIHTPLKGKDRSDFNKQMARFVWYYIILITFVITKQFWNLIIFRVCLKLTFLDFGIFWRFGFRNKIAIRC